MAEINGNKSSKRCAPRWTRNIQPSRFWKNSLRVITRKRRPFGAYNYDPTRRHCVYRAWWLGKSKGVFSCSKETDLFADQSISSAQKWAMSPDGQHLELGIAEMNLFLALGAAGLSHSLFGERLIPIGTVYDLFVARGLDALNYACYQDARFMVIGTPSGVSLAPEGGAHQSIGTPLIGITQAAHIFEQLQTNWP